MNTYGLQISADGEKYNNKDGKPFSTVADLVRESKTLLSGDIKLSMPPKWSKEGYIYLKHNTPLPCEILALIFEVTAGDL